MSQSQEFLTKIIKEAGEILKKHFANPQYTVTEKSGVDFTTQADTETDAFIRKAILSEYPHAILLTEETAQTNQDYSELRKAKQLFIIDPLDGTTNFKHGVPHFAISIAEIANGQPITSVIYKPVTDELVIAEKDKEGATKNGITINVSNTQNLREAVIACDWPWDLGKRHFVPEWLSKLHPKVRQIKIMGSAVSDLVSLASGTIDVYIHACLKPWDEAAASLIVEKAGGKITTSTGEKWDIFKPDILASNGTLHDKILELINS
ncbi:MAG: hypothetical protein A3B25_00145 [Candidatus Ryanbacteria bacterium RIFCSPLOWO2_01_FULL_48_26]|uniref:Inositol-1-monophosphatase n=1 Tax=Candidatus Ryanbacteria bacterium RIFCSPLOWO2_01_FULL_48_26 TaxID=1802126 RepID=A0A1G2GT27_9BACT|nr:MAG: hypothetical protein A3B25_00145 [Candidatus Ryanbacteria bacterium RIFCSPLOWO2_01_FULL_48_26]